MDGSWSLPAGAHDGNESFIVGALRELKEETGVLAKPEDCRFLHIQQVFTASSEWLAVYIGVDRFSGTPSIMESDKHDRVEWRDIAKAGAEPVVPYVLAALREISRKSNFSEFRA
jgi:8-oxo-dGTP pyrophosphatase MutT (NUDIX family)